MDKQQRKAAIKGWKHAGLTNLIDGMPLAPQQLHRLLDYLAANLKVCDHTTKLTAIFLHVEKLEKDKVLSWLAERGGFCDCEVLANLADLDDSLRRPPPAPRVVPQKQRDRVARSLDTVAGWNLAKLAGGWRVGNLYVPTEPVCLELGKKGGCAIEIMEAPLPPGDQATDEYWSRLWYSLTALPLRGTIQVAREALALPDGYRSTLVRASNWTPVYCWIVPDAGLWYLRVRSESNRYAGDLPQIASLVSGLANA